MSGLTLDAGALIAIDHGKRPILLLLARAKENGDAITIPATALAQVLRSPARQAMVVRLCRQPATDLRPLDGPDATAVGLMLAASGTADITDAHVAVCARAARQVVITSDAADIARLAPELTTIRV